MLNLLNKIVSVTSLNRFRLHDRFADKRFIRYFIKKKQLRTFFKRMDTILCRILINKRSKIHIVESYALFIYIYMYIKHFIWTDKWVRGQGKHAIESLLITTGDLRVSPDKKLSVFRTREYPGPCRVVSTTPTPSHDADDSVSSA